MLLGFHQVQDEKLEESVLLQKQNNLVATQQFLVKCQEACKKS